MTNTANETQVKLTSAMITAAKAAQSLDKVKLTLQQARKAFEVNIKKD